MARTMKLSGEIAEGYKPDTTPREAEWGEWLFHISARSRHEWLRRPKKDIWPVYCRSVRLESEGYQT
jgi:hypothetical protein